MMRQFTARILNKLVPNFYWNNIAGCFPKIESDYHVVFSGLQKKPFSGGKVECWRFFPPFCRRLARHGIKTSFITDVKSIKALDLPETIIVHVYKEVTDSEKIGKKLPKLIHATTLHSPSMGEIIGSKRKSNEFLSSNGIRVPKIVFSKSNDLVFSNEDRSSGASTKIISPGSRLSHNRYNTEFIDTIVDFKGKDYYSSVRLLCVGTEIIHAYCRARSTLEEDASVHAKNTPLDPLLIEWLQREQVDAHREKLERFARQVGRALGLGFYSYDLLLDRNTQLFYLAEPGFKFNDPAYVERLRPISNNLPSHKILFNEDFAFRSADLFARQVHEMFA